MSASAGNAPGWGCSTYVAQPSWLADTACSHGTVADAVTDGHRVAGPDSQGSTGPASWHVLGGTSVATPVTGASFARDGVAPEPVVAAAGGYAREGSLVDVTSGPNRTRPTRPLALVADLGSAVTGDDGPTGNGAPKGLTAQTGPRPGADPRPGRAPERPVRRGTRDP